MPKDTGIKDRLDRHRVMLDWLSSGPDLSAGNGTADLEKRFKALISMLQKESKVVRMKPRFK